MVLIIEDEPILMMQLVDYVEEAGCQAVEATSVAEAIGLLETRIDIRVVFSDLDMRGSSAGLHLARAIRNRWPPVELLMTSAINRRANELPERGVFVGKPFDSRKVHAALKHFVE